MWVIRGFTGLVISVVLNQFHFFAITAISFEMEHQHQISRSTCLNATHTHKQTSFMKPPFLPSYKTTSNKNTL